MAQRVAVGLTLCLLLALSHLPGQPAAAGQQAEQPDKEKEKIQQVVDGLIAALSANNYDAMARYYAPEVTIVSSRYEPPLAGWANLRRVYLARDPALQDVEIAPEDTRIERREKLAWVYYRWNFVGRVGEQYFTTLGHTTLVLEKRGRDWLILHNHSSAVAPPPTQRPTTPQPPSSPPQQ